MVDLPSSSIYKTAFAQIGHIICLSRHLVLLRVNLGRPVRGLDTVVHDLAAH